MLEIVSYGGGKNSCAVLVGLHERGERPDHILFADTGGEKPSTYKHVAMMYEWCMRVGFPPILVVRESETLENDCLRRGALPGLAYGFRSCSEHFKVRPQKRWLKERGISLSDVTFLIGIDAGESHRQQYHENRYPLIEWNWDRNDCIAAIDRAGLPQPPKSSCFFCPAMKKHEILELKKQHPDLLQRALNIESSASLTSVKGLGRGWSWSDMIKADDDQLSLFRETIEIPCECME